MVREPQSSKYRRTRLFVLTLGYSRKAIRLLVFRSSTLTTAELVAPEERTFSLHFDIITRKPALYRFQKPFKHTEALEEGLKEIELGPRKHPQPGEIGPLAIETILRATPGLTDHRRDVLAVRALNNIKPFYIRALALVYRSNEGDDVQIGFVIDGKPSQEHELAFARSDEFQKLAKSLSIDPAEKKALETAVPEAIGLDPRSEVSNELRTSPTQPKLR